MSSRGPHLLPVDTRRPVPQLHSLTQLKLKHLKKNKCARGRVAAAIVRSNGCFITLGEYNLIPILVENREMLLCIYTAGSSSKDFKTGSKLAIKEPFYFPSGKHGALVLAMDCLAVGSTISVEYFGLEDAGVPPDELRLKGNDAFTQGDVLMASLYYSECISKLTTVKVGGDQRQLLMAISNRAEAYLALGMFDHAYDDALKALSMDPLHVKSMLRMGKALAANHEHEQALAALKIALELASSSKEVASLEEARDKFEACLRQSRDGVYDLSEFLLGDLKPELATTFSDYVANPVEVFMTSDGRGRGLRVTMDVQLGELLLVSNPIALLGEAPASTLYVETMEKCATSARCYFQVQALADTGVVPTMSAFRPNTGVQPSSLPTNRIVDPVTISITVDRFCFSHRIDSEKLAWTGMWGLPALLNHSCCPNVSLLKVGNAMFVRAASDIKAGEEMTISYTDPVASWFGFRRDRLSKNFGFTCKCERCKVESRLQGWLVSDKSGIARTYVDRVSKNTATLGDCMLFFRQLMATMVEQSVPAPVEKAIVGGFVDVAEALEIMEADELALFAFAAGPGRLSTLVRLIRYFMEAEKYSSAALVRAGDTSSLNLNYLASLVGTTRNMFLSCFGTLDTELSLNLIHKWTRLGTQDVLRASIN